MSAGTVSTGRSDPVLRSFGDLPPDAFDALAALEARVHAASTHYDDDAPWGPENFARELPGKPALSTVALVAGTPVGFLVASARPGGVHVHRIAVDPAHWSAGIGSRLLAGLLVRAEGAVTVVCDPRNARALGLYTRAGFRVVRRRPDGKVRLSMAPLPPARELGVWYVFTATGMHSGHAAHLPGLVDALARSVRASAVPYGDPAGLPPMRPSVGWARAFVRLLARARRERVDVMFVRIHWKLAALLWLAGRLGGGWRVALWSSGGVGFLPGTGPAPGGRLGRLVHRLVLRHAVDAVITGPRRLVAEYAQRYRLRRDRLLLAHNDIDVRAWQAKAATGETVGGTAGDGTADLAAQPAVARWLTARHRFLYAHGLDPIRGADRLPALFAAIRAELDDAALLVLGDGPLRDRLGPDLLLAGRVPNSATAWAMARAHCLLVPSRQEGFPRVLLEAMAVGVPPVAFDVGGCADVLGDRHGNLVAPDGDLDRFAELAVAAGRRCAAEGPRADLVERAAVFDTAPVAAELAATLRCLRAHGAGPAAWLSRSLERGRHAV
jgi:glycosyltransferase involved in cell wall biosynthesis